MAGVAPRPIGVSFAASLLWMTMAGGLPSNAWTVPPFPLQKSHGIEPGQPPPVFSNADVEVMITGDRTINQICQKMRVPEIN